MDNSKLKLIRVTTVPISLGGLLKGQLHFMSEFFEVLGISSKGDGKLDEVGKKEQIPVIGVEMTRSITPFKDLAATYKLYRIFRKEKPSFVHTHTPKAGTVGMLAAKLAGVPNRLHTIAGLPLLVATGPKRMLLNFVEKITYSCATKIYPNSNGLKDIIINEKFCSPNKLKVIGNGSSNGIDTSHFDPELFSSTRKNELKATLHIQEEDFVFIFVGRFVKDKGINELITAFLKVNKELPKTKLLVIGDYEHELDPLKEETINNINSHPNIINTSWQNDVRPYFAIADALVFPSYREGFPNVVMEAGAMGLPIIATDINGCNEIVKDGLNGVIIPVKSEIALQKNMKLFYNDQKMLGTFKKNARKAICDNYERKYVWNELLKEYRELQK